MAADRGGGEPRGPGDEPAQRHLLLAAGGLVTALAIGLTFGLRLIGRMGRLAEAAEHLGSGGGGPTTAPGSGDDLDRLAAALRNTAERLRSERRELPP